MITFSCNIIVYIKYLNILRPHYFMSDIPSQNMGQRLCVYEQLGAGEYDNTCDNACDSCQETFRSAFLTIAGSWNRDELNESSKPVIPTIIIDGYDEYDDCQNMDYSFDIKRCTHKITDEYSEYDGEYGTDGVMTLYEYGEGQIPTTRAHIRSAGYWMMRDE